MNIPELSQRFERLFGSRPRIARAPGRVNLIGEHTDYNDGFVMPAAVAFSVYIAFAARPDRRLVVHSEEFPGEFEFDLDRLPQHKTGSCFDYVLGVASVLRQAGHPLRGTNMLVHGEVPIGAGLSSSAAIEVASGLALVNLEEKQLALPDLARICQRAENEFVGARVGIMDQFVSCMGRAAHAFLLDCRSLTFEFVPLPAEVELVVCNTLVKHDLAAGDYNIRRSQCEEGVRYFAKWDSSIRALRDVSVELLDRHAADIPPIIWKRCSHVVHENKRTTEAAAALSRGDLQRMRELMRRSHESLRDLYEVSCRELDIMVDAAQDLPGFCGGRMTGGGFGGCTVNLVCQENAPQFAALIAERYTQKTGILPQIYRCSAENGAQILS
jgi:galactokinase